MPCAAFPPPCALSTAERPPWAGELPAALRGGRAPCQGARASTPTPGALLLGGKSRRAPGARALPPSAAPQHRCGLPGRHPALSGSVGGNGAVAVPDPLPSPPRGGEPSPACASLLLTVQSPGTHQGCSAARHRPLRTHNHTVSWQLRGSPAPGSASPRGRLQRMPAATQGARPPCGAGQRGSCLRPPAGAVSPQLAPNGLCPFRHLKQREQQWVRSGSDPFCPRI